MSVLKALRKALLAIQLSSLALTAAILYLPVSLNLGVENLDAAGSTLTLGILMTTVICHLRARKASFHPGLLALLGVFAPAYALMGGTLRFVAGYNVVALGAHVMIYVVLHNRLADNHRDSKSG